MSFQSAIPRMACNYKYGIKYLTVLGWASEYFFLYAIYVNKSKCLIMKNALNIFCDKIGIPEYGQISLKSYEIFRFYLSF